MRLPIIADLSDIEHGNNDNGFYESIVIKIKIIKIEIKIQREFPSLLHFLVVSLNSTLGVFISIFPEYFPDSEMID